MKFRSTWWLLLAVIALGLFIHFRERDGLPGHRAAGMRRMAFPLNPELVRRFSIETKGDVIECVLHQNEWRLVRPVFVRAEQSRVARFLADISRLPRLRTMDAQERRARGLNDDAFGLANPALKVVVVEPIRTRTFVVGGVSKLDQSVYVREMSAPEDIYSVDQRLLAVIPQRVDELRDAAVLRGSEDQVRRMGVDGPAGFVQVGRDVQGRWNILQPAPGRADMAMVDDLVERLFRARIERFVADGPTDRASYGLDDPVVSVSVELDGMSAPQELLLGRPVAEATNLVYACVASNQIVAVDAGLVERLSRRPDDLRDRRLLPFPMRDVQRIRIEDGDRFVELENRRSGGWYVIQPREWKADDELVEKRLMQWGHLSVSRFLLPDDTDMFRAGLEPPAQVVSFGRVGGEEVRLAIGHAPQNGGAQAVRQMGGNVIYEVEGRIDELFPTDPLPYRTRRVLEMAPDDITALTLSRPDLPAQRIERDAHGDFVPVATGMVVCAEAVQVVLDAFRGLDAQSFVTLDAGTLQVFGLAPPVAMVTVDLKGRTGLSKTLMLGCVVPGSDGSCVYAMVRGHDEVFTLPRPMADRLMAEWVVPNHAKQEP